jgi:hypothetical protein
LPYGNGRISCVVAKAAGTAIINYNTTATSGCVSSSSVAITVAPITAPAAITGASAVCVGNTIALATTATGGVWSSTAPAYASVNASGVVTGKSAGLLNIRYTITNAAGCSAYSSKAFTSNALPVTPSIGYKAPFSNPQAGAPYQGFCVGKVFGVSGTPASGVWSAGGCISVTNAGIATINTTGAGSLTYTYTDANGCASSRTMTGTGYTCAARGVTVNNEKLETKNEFSIFPNPAKSIVNLKVETLVGEGQIIVTDLYGKTVKSQPLSMGNNTVDIANLSKGFYLISTITNEGKTTKKLVVE